MSRNGIIPSGIFRNKNKVLLVIKNLLTVNYLFYQKVLNNLNVCEFPGMFQPGQFQFPLGDNKPTPLLSSLTVLILPYLHINISVGFNRLVSDLLSLLMDKRFI